MFHAEQRSMTNKNSKKGRRPGRSCRVGHVACGYDAIVWDIRRMFFRNHRLCNSRSPGIVFGFWPSCTACAEYSADRACFRQLREFQTPRAAIGTGHSRAYGCHDRLRRRFPLAASASVRTGGPGARLERECLSDFFRRHGELVEPLADGVGDGVSRRRDDRYHHHFPQASGR